MAFKKLDKARVAADEYLDGLTTRRLTYGLSACNQERMCGGRYTWRLNNPLYLGSVGERYHPLFLPISPEATSIKWRLRYECLYASVKIRGSVPTGPGKTTDPGSFSTLSTTGGRTTSAWVTTSVLEAQRQGRDDVELMVRFQSEASATSAATNITLSIDGESVSTSSSLLSTFNERDVLGLTFKESGSGLTVRYLNEGVTQAIRTHSSKFWLWPWLGFRSGMPLWGAVTATRYGVLKVYAIEWEEQHGTPYEAEGRETFPWQNDARHYATVAPGRGGSASALRQFYDAGEYLQAHRTPIYSVAPTPRPDNSTTWTDYDESLTAWASVQFKTSTSYSTLAQVPIPDGETFTGSAPITTRKGLQVDLYYLALAESPNEWTWQFQLETYDAAGASVTSGTDVEVTIKPLGEYGGYHSSIYLYQAELASDSSSFNAWARNNMQGQFDLQDAGLTGVQRLRLSFNDTSGPGKYLRVKLRPKSTAPGVNWRFITVGCVVRPPQTRLWSEVGS